MIQELLDNRKFKISFGLGIAFPFTVLVLFSTLLGLPITLYTITFPISNEVFNLNIFVLGLANILGLFGIVGGWLRLCSRHSSYSDRWRKVTKTLLALGILSALLLFTQFWITTTSNEIGNYLIFAGLIFIGAVFYVGT